MHSFKYSDLQNALCKVHIYSMKLYLYGLCNTQFCLYRKQETFAAMSFFCCITGVWNNALCV